VTGVASALLRRLIPPADAIVAYRQPMQSSQSTLQPLHAEGRALGAGPHQQQSLSARSDHDEVRLGPSMLTTFKLSADEVRSRLRLLPSQAAGLAPSRLVTRTASTCSRSGLGRLCSVCRQSRGRRVIGTVLYTDGGPGRNGPWT
jgi:hypothetical protein